MPWFKINFDDVFFNGLSNAEIGILVRYRCLCQQKDIDVLTWEQVCFNFDCKERKVISKLVGISPEVSPEFAQSSPEVSPEFAQSSPEVSPEFAQSSPEVSLKLSSKNNDIPIIYNINNIHTREKEKKDIHTSDKSSVCITQTPQKIKTLVPVDWQPGEVAAQKLKDRSLDVPKVVEKFINSCHAKGLKYIDFDRAILAWDWSGDKSLQVKNDDDEKCWF